MADALGMIETKGFVAMVEAAAADGRLRPGGSVVEYTGGSTGVDRAPRIGPRASAHPAPRLPRCPSGKWARCAHRGRSQRARRR